MGFTSFWFPVFVLVTAICYYIWPARSRWILLLAASYGFYYVCSPGFVWLLFSVTLVTFGTGRLLKSADSSAKRENGTARNKAEGDAGVFRKTIGPKAAKGILAVGILLDLAPLLTYKYLAFLVESVTGHRGITDSWELLLPLGISFFTFKAIGYLVDVYRGKEQAERNFFRFGLFMAFFPELPAGPIDRGENLLAQIRKPVKADGGLIKKGLLLALWGYFLKLVVADRIAILVGAVYGNLNTYSGFVVLFAVLLYATQLYCDFAAVTNIARGVGAVFGYHLPENFRQPYAAVTVTEFWRRWHMSLTGWFRDYLYIPLGGNRKGQLRKYGNVLLVFLVSGLWHGADWTFVIWGGLNGLFQIAEGVWHRYAPAGQQPGKRRKEEKAGVGRQGAVTALKRLRTYLLVSVSLVFFRAESLEQAFLVFRRMWKWNPWVLFDSGIYDFAMSYKGFGIMLLGILLLYLADYLREMGRSVYQWVQSLPFILRLVGCYGLLFAILIFGIYGSAYDAAGFIYTLF